MHAARYRLTGPEIEAGYSRKAHEGIAVLPQVSHQPVIILRFFLLDMNPLRPRHVQRRK